MPWTVWLGIALAVAVVLLLVGAVASAAARRCSCCCCSGDDQAGLWARYERVPAREGGRLGKGSFGIVWLVRRKVDGEYFAMKVIPCESHRDVEAAMREIDIVRSVHGHPNMIRIADVFLSEEAANILERAQGAVQPGPRKSRSPPRNQRDDGSSHQLLSQDSVALPGVSEDGEVRPYVSLVMPYYSDGDLRRFVRDFHLFSDYGSTDKVPEHLVLSYCAQLLCLLEYLHSRTPPIVHRDLKPENILLADSFTRVVVTDFGLAKVMQSRQYLQTHAGTLPYVAPECWDRHYGTSVDVWAVGCVAYAMCTRRVEGHNVRMLFTDAQKPDFLDSITVEVGNLRAYSPRMVHLIRELLTPRYQLRPSAAEVCRWLGVVPFDPAPTQRLSITPSTGSEVKRYMEQFLLGSGATPLGGAGGERFFVLQSTTDGGQGSPGGTPPSAGHALFPRLLGNHSLLAAAAAPRQPPPGLPPLQTHPRMGGAADAAPQPCGASSAAHLQTPEGTPWSVHTAEHCQGGTPGGAAAQQDDRPRWNREAQRTPAARDPGSLCSGLTGMQHTTPSSRHPADGSSGRHGAISGRTRGTSAPVGGTPRSY